MGLRALAIAYLENASKSHSNNCPAVRMPNGRPDRTLSKASNKLDISSVSDRSDDLLSNVGQHDADKRNIKAKREGSTFRYCRCGDYAECAWSIEGRRELWRCFRCLAPSGSA